MTNRPCSVGANSSDIELGAEGSSHSTPCADQTHSAIGGKKTIGLMSGVMLLINNLAGPTIVSMPALAQEAGWLAVMAVMLAVSLLTICCGHLLVSALRRMPHNDELTQRVEYTDLIRFAFPSWSHAALMLCFHGYAIMTLMTYIIQTTQVADYVVVDINGCAPGFSLSPSLGLVCASDKNSSTPFGDALVLPFSMVVVAIVCVPFSLWNLDDNVHLQWAAIIGLTAMAVVWLWLLVAEPAFPSSLPLVTYSQGGLIGTVLFNFAFVSTLPSWLCEKRPEVSISTSFNLAVGYIVVVYTAVAIVGGLAYSPFYQSDENLFSKINAGGTLLGRATVTAYPLLQNLTSIPVFSILIRYNLLHSGLGPRLSSVISVAAPWLLSVPFYTGRGFQTIAEVGGLVTSSVINFAVPPLALWLLSRRAPKIE